MQESAYRPKKSPFSAATEKGAKKKLAGRTRRIMGYLGNIVKVRVNMRGRHISAGRAIA